MKARPLMPRGANGGGILSPPPAPSPPSPASWPLRRLSRSLPGRATSQAEEAIAGVNLARCARDSRLATALEVLVQPHHAGESRTTNSKDAQDQTWEGPAGKNVQRAARHHTYDGGDETNHLEYLL